MRKINALFIIVFLIAADQISKWWITEFILRARAGGEDLPRGFAEWILNPPPRLGFAQVEILPFFNLTMVWNHGISFGLFNQNTEYGPWILTGLTAAITAVFAVLLVLGFFSARMQMIGAAFVIGGAIGNIIDRIRFGAVADFFDFHVMGYHWPAFNIADSCICVGVGLLLVHAVFFEKPLPAKG